MKENDKTKDFHITGLKGQLNDLGHQVEIDYEKKIIYLYNVDEYEYKWYYFSMNEKQEVSIHDGMVDRKTVERVFTLYDLLFKEQDNETKLWQSNRRARLRVRDY